MKRNMARTMLVIISVVTLCLSLASVAQAQVIGTCSLQGVAGTWAYTYTGTLFASPTTEVPVAAVGTFTSDGMGNLGGTQRRSVGGAFAQERIAGTITLNSHCVGTLNVNVYHSGQLVRSAVIAVVYDNNRNNLRAMFESLTLPDGTNVPVVITSEGRRLFQ